MLKIQSEKGILYNQYHASMHALQIAYIIIIDGDDWLAHEHVFETINTAYQDENIWLTYGQFWYLKKNKKGFCRPIPTDIIAKKCYP